MFGLASFDPGSTSSREANAQEPKAVWNLVEKGDDSSALVVDTECGLARPRNSIATAIFSTQLDKAAA